MGLLDFLKPRKRVQQNNDGNSYADACYTGGSDTDSGDISCDSGCDCGGGDCGGGGGGGGD